MQQENITPNFINYAKLDSIIYPDCAKIHGFFNHLNFFKFKSDIELTNLEIITIQLTILLKNTLKFNENQKRV